MDCNSRAHVRVTPTLVLLKLLCRSLAGVMDVSSRQLQHLLHSCLSRWKDEEKLPGQRGCRAPGMCVPVLCPPRFRDSHMSAQHFQTHRHFRPWPRPRLSAVPVRAQQFCLPALTRLPPLPWRQLHRLRSGWTGPSTPADAGVDGGPESGRKRRSGRSPAGWRQGVSWPWQGGVRSARRPSPSRPLPAWRCAGLPRALEAPRPWFARLTLPGLAGAPRPLLAPPGRYLQCVQAGL